MSLPQTVQQELPQKEDTAPSSLPWPHYGYPDSKTRTDVVKTTRSGRVVRPSISLNLEHVLFCFDRSDVKESDLTLTFDEVFIYTFDYTSQLVARKLRCYVTQYHYVTGPWVYNKRDWVNLKRLCAFFPDNITSFRELLPCVPFSLLSSSGKSLHNVSFQLIRKLTTRRNVFR